MLRHHGSFRKALIFTDFQWQGGVVQHSSTWAGPDASWEWATLFIAFSACAVGLHQGLS